MTQDILITPGSGEPQILFRGSGTSDTPIELNVLSSYQSASGSGTALVFEGQEGQLFAVTDNLSSGTIFSVGDITGLSMLSVDASGDVKLGEFANSVIVYPGLTLDDNVPSTTTNVLYNDGGDLKWNGITVVETGASQAVNGSGVANYIAQWGDGNTLTYNSTNTISGSYAMAIAGSGNVASGDCSFIGGGFGNQTTNVRSTIPGGASNTASGYASTVGGGQGNQATNTYAIVAGGAGNYATGSRSIIGGGESNYTGDIYAVAVGGNTNCATGCASFIGGGYSNCANASYATLVAGYNNTSSGIGSFVGGGYSNTATSNDSVVVGGNGNYAWKRSAVVGGVQNSASSCYGSIIGGCSNLASAAYSTIGGGFNNTAASTYSSVLGGSNNSVSGVYSAILGGQSNDDGGNAAVFILGTGITATDSNTTYTQKLNTSYTLDPSGTIFNVEGSNGSIFSVVDDLSGALMSVNTIAGLPVLEVNADYSIVGGRFNQNDFVITTSGDVGIGTANPTEKLDVNGNIHIPAASYIQWGTAGTNTIIKDDSSGNRTYISPRNSMLDILNTAGTNWGTLRTAYINGGSTTSQNLILRNGGNDTNSEIKLTSTEVVINDNSSNLDFRVESDGNANMLFVDGIANRVGIGTGSPGYQLDIQDSSSSILNVSIGSSAQTLYSVLRMYSNTGNGQIFKNGSGYASYGGSNSLNIFDNSGPIAFHPNNTANVMYLSTAGNVGIGTASPAGKLDIQQNTTGNLLSRLYNTNNSGTGSASLRITNAGNNNNGSRLEFSDTNYYVGTIAGDRTNGIQFYTGNQSSPTQNFRMKIDPNGNVGIGTTSPATKLDVNGPVRVNSTSAIGSASLLVGDILHAGSAAIAQFNGFLRFKNGMVIHDNTTIANSFFINYDGSDGLHLHRTEGTGSQNILLVEDGGSVGIGTTSPNAVLHAYGSTPSGTVFNVEGTNGSLFSVVDNLSGVLMSVNNNAGLPVFEVYDDDSIIAGRFAQDDFVISSSGNVGIGTDTPAGKLHVVGEAQVDNLKLDGNTLSSTNTNGNINITPNGTGGIAGGANATVTGSYAVVGGGLNNSTSSSYYGMSTVSGGGYNNASEDYSTVSGGYSNTASGYSATIGGGYGSTASGNVSTVGGGGFNIAYGNSSVISGGANNKACAHFSSVSGGNQNFVNARHGSINGGHFNVIQSPTNECCARGATIGGGVGHNTSGGTLNATTGDITGTVTCCNAGSYSTIGGGFRNCATGNFSTIAGGVLLIACGTGSAIGGGMCNTASGSYSTVGGGGGFSTSNYAKGCGSTVSGGKGNYADGLLSTVGGGGSTTAGTCQGNLAICDYSTISGGLSNRADGNCSFIGGGAFNVTCSNSSTVSGGSSNCATGNCSTVSGGRGNTASDYYSTVSGGYSNTSSGCYSTIGGGIDNEATSVATYSVIGGGINNTVSAYSAMIGGGFCNTASAYYGTISGGLLNTASGYASTVVGGSNAKASRFGEVAHAAGRFAQNGDAQHSTFVARKNTTDATANIELFLDSSSQRMTLTAETTWTFDIKLSAYNDTDNTAAWWIFRGGIRRNAANVTTLIGSLIEERDYEGTMSGTSAAVTADDTNESLKIAVTGLASKNIRWVAVVDVAQVSWGTP